MEVIQIIDFLAQIIKNFNTHCGYSEKDVLLRA